ncbi:MAG TPA: hypothetical protein VJ508_15060, partial [Saprospiraceae bacterium]|nr:hypothetical protein [Saprospiraceae bacterium]
RGNAPENRINFGYSILNTESPQNANCLVFTAVQDTSALLPDSENEFHNISLDLNNDERTKIEFKEDTHHKHCDHDLARSRSIFHRPQKW